MESFFNLEIKFNHENDVSLSIELEKTCYSKGELINGTLTLTPKPNSKDTELISTVAKISFQEKQCYEFLETYSEKDRDIIKPTRKLTQELNSLGTFPMNFSNFANAKMIPNLKIPFQIKVPNKAHPSCIFEGNAYIIHFLTCEFESLKVKKSIPFIVKNNFYYTTKNNLYRKPTVYKRIIEKNKFGVLSSGNLTLTVTLPQNICPYYEALPVLIEIDCSNLKNIKIKGVKMHLYKTYRKHNQENKKFIKEEKTEEILIKKYPLSEGLSKYEIEDDIKIPRASNNLVPEKVYEILDKNKIPGSINYENIKLFPTCTGGLLSCAYFLKIIVETNTVFSTNEEIIIPIDFYSPFEGGDNNDDNEDNIENNIDNTDNIEDNLNINQQVSISESKPKKEEKKNKDKKDDNNPKGFQILPDFDDN